VLVNNIFGAIPFLQLPSFSHPGSAYAIAAIFYILWVGIGLKKHGLRYFKLAVVPSGVPWYILPIVVPIEIISNFIVRPVTHSLRLFATMLAGHLIVTLAGSAIEYMVSTGNILLQGTSVLVLVGAVAMYMLESSRCSPRSTSKAHCTPTPTDSQQVFPVGDDPKQPVAASGILKGTQWKYRVASTSLDTVSPQSAVVSVWVSCSRPTSMA
jgi:hypothetical protein